MFAHFLFCTSIVWNMHITIFHMQDLGILPSAVGFCKDPKFVRSLKALLQLASRNVPSPILIAGT